MSSTPRLAVGRRRDGRSRREMSSEARAPAGATTSRSGIAPAVTSVRAVPERVDRAAVGARILAAVGAVTHLEAAAQAVRARGGAGGPAIRWRDGQKI